MITKSASLGQFIRNWRLGEEMTQAEFAKVLGVSKQRLCDIEHNRKGVSIQLCKKIAKKLSLPPEWIVRKELEYQLRKEGIALKVS